MKLQPKIKLLDHVRQAIRLKNYSYSTEKAYVYWIKRFILFSDKRHPKTMGGPEIEEFLSYLAVEMMIIGNRMPKKDDKNQITSPENGGTNGDYQIKIRTVDLEILDPSPERLPLELLVG